ncbi:hypothetical protein ONZ51_g11788 [Trametes cubensis]|uniref:Uncharacterized protein n=1 Tax=Trametes cubensis TaxID=1111947 RepID=A0AAD7X5I2_9APHY|nr:hypothetical protein ONZ51_g11788 [Trametes cubensis]
MRSPAPPVGTMTDQFGMMLLEHVQESHERMDTLMKTFMTEQSEAHKRLRDTVHAVHVKVDQFHNLVPLRGSRRNGRFEVVGEEQSAHAQDRPSLPADKRRTRSDRSKPLPSIPDMGSVLTTLKSSVRTHLKLMLKFSTWKELVSRSPPLTDEEAEAYQTGRFLCPCTENTFRIDFIHDWKRFPFNLASRDFFVQNMLKTIKGGGFEFDAAVIPFIIQAHVEHVLDSHMDYCRRKYREAYNLHTWDAKDPDDAEMIAEQEAKMEKDKKRKAINSRKKTLFNARLTVILEMGLGRHLILFDRLLPQNMSGDETDGPRRVLPMTYRVVESRWQSVALKSFLRALDAMYREDWERPRHGQRAKGGNPPRTRLIRAGGPVEDGYAPVGLWRNCYDSEWLKNLPSYQRRALKIINADYDFDVTPEDDDMAADASWARDDAASEDEIEDLIIMFHHISLDFSSTHSFRFTHS